MARIFKKTSVYYKSHDFVTAHNNNKNIDKQQRQVCLLTLMDCVTLASRKTDHIVLHAECIAKLTLSSERRSIAHCYTDQQLSDISTVRLKLHLVDLLLSYYTSKFTTNAQQIEPTEIEPSCIASFASIVVRVNNRDPPSTALLISLNDVHAKMGHVSPTMPLYHPFGKT